ncbi:Lrp/AsnC ligand binding domain-containing protein [Candidatus Woesearchaeota archaeon]|jgi:DNA-binding Lrp family transcriptional regulator|nr:Lrp/AsnC ligand binding domain-containing protein [Candidatus Woesearchaeota archaeon]MBT5272770.1 Lrp/AsnC ligand binding domain-containing protein [Candidatus Woesearchaeota archaeon]MBT6040382.1 Lrp/AsnC ligand binding domain-containing protein [Candidatus Woesearchaeota archaeon]MBT6336985.1 Lrp/AsnC ligand binding domain-containing protein [Candidatus Woesearchaeota archaeon]MBT7926871.1 Lrp/AsnC ligand binding domain-containing protein [Candidatus Woesearchaeota archaeon]
MVTAFVLMHIKPNKLKIVSNTLSKLEEVKEIHEVYGRFDAIAKIEVANNQELQSFFQNKISIIEGIRTSETLITLDNDYNGNKDNNVDVNELLEEADHEDKDDDVEYEV